MVFKCILFLNHFLSLIPSPSYLPFPGTWDLFQVATMMDPHSRTTWEELLNTREITKAVMRLTANIRGCLSGLCEKSFTFLGALSRGRDPCSPKTFHHGSLSSERLRGKPAAVAGGNCPHQGVVSSMAPGSSRDSPRSLIPASWRPRMDRPTSSSPLTESTRVSTPADSVWPHIWRCCELLRCINGMCVFLGKVSGTSDSEVVLWLPCGMGTPGTLQGRGYWPFLVNPFY